MEGSEKITGNKIFGILDQLKNNHTTIDMHVMGTSFDALSIILDVSKGVFPYFCIDFPGKSRSSVPVVEGGKCYFEFYSEEKIQCKFKAAITAITDKYIKFDFPEFIEKTQRRKAFRVAAPDGTKLKSSRNKEIDFDVLNIGEGGLLAGIKSSRHNDSIFFNGSVLKGLTIISFQDGIAINTDVESAEIVRVEDKKELGSFYYGIKFTEVNIKSQNEIKRFIYYCQRQLLKKRGGFEV